LKDINNGAGADNCDNTDSGDGTNDVKGIIGNGEDVNAIDGDEDVVVRNTYLYKKVVLVTTKCCRWYQLSYNKSYIGKLGGQSHKIIMQRSTLGMRNIWL